MRSPVVHMLHAPREQPTSSVVRLKVPIEETLCGAKVEANEELDAFTGLRRYTRDPADVTCPRCRKLMPSR